MPGAGARPSVAARGASGYVEANGLRLHYLEYGRGEPALVIVPGITSPAITWEFVAEALARDRRVLTLDVRGRGLSDKPPSGYGLLEYSQDLAGFIQGVALERPLVLGHSMGARIAAALGATFPGAARALIVVDPPLSGPGRPPYPFPLEGYVEALRKARAGGTAADMRPYFPTWTDEQLKIRAAWLPSCDERAVVESYRKFHEEDFFVSWRRVPPPVLFLNGGTSPVVPPAALAEIRAANPQASIETVPAAGHMIPWDNFTGFMQAVQRFVGKQG